MSASTTWVRAGCGAARALRYSSTARSAWQVARKLQVSTPIIDEVYRILYEGKDVRQALQDLTGRESKAE